MTSVTDRFSAKLLCGAISITFFWIALGTQMRPLLALFAVLLLLIGAVVFTVCVKFALRSLQQSPSNFMRMQLWTSVTLATSTLIMHVLGVFFGTARGLFIPETATTAIATISASAVVATCLTRLFEETFEIFHHMQRATTWLLSYSIMNIVLTLPSVIVFIAGF